MGELNVDDLPDLNEANAFNVDDLPDLKKKEVSQPAAQVSGQTSKTGTSNISQSNYNLDLSLPTVNPNPNNVALPGLGQPFKSNKDVLGKGTPIDNTPKKESTQNPYAVDITDKSKDNSKTQTVRQAQVQNDIDTGILEAKNPTTYIGASVDYTNKAKEVTGKDDAQALLDYGKVIGVDDDLFSRLPDGDKQVYQNNQQLQDLYKQRDILSNTDDQTKDSHLKDVNKSIAEIEKANAQLFAKRNSDIDADILDMQKQLNIGTKTIQQSTGSGSTFGQEKMDMAPQVTQTLPLTDEDKSQLKSQIAQLQKKKGDFLAGAHTPEQVFKDFQPQIKMYEEKNIIPKAASSIDKLKIYYGVKLKQLQSLKQKSEQEGKIFTSSQDGILNNIKEGIGDAFGALAQSSSGIAGQASGYENPIRQRLIDDKTTKSIKEIEGQLDAIAPIIAINRNPNDKKNSFGTAFKNKFVDELSQTTKNNTSQENAIQIQNTLKDTGLELSEDRTKEIEKQAKAKDNGQFTENIGSELGGMTELMMELGATTAVLPFAGAEAALTKIAPKGRALLGMAGEIMKDTKLGKLAYDATVEGVKLAAVGKVNERLKDVGTFTNGAAFSVGGKLGGVLEKQLIGLFGEQLPEAVKLATAIAGKTVAESIKMGGADLVNMYGESKSGKEFLQSVKDKYGDLDHDLSFGIQMVALATVFSGSEIGNTLSHYVKKFRNDLSSADAEKFDAITHDLKDEVHTATDNVIQQSNNTGQATAKDGSSTISKTETDIANKINKGQDLTPEEQDYYGALKESIDKLITGKKNATIESAVIEINGKTYEGKNHAEAILKAKADGQDISNVDRKGEGKFKLSDGTIIDRAEAKSRFGQDRSELMIPQDENAKLANKEYQKITNESKSPNENVITGQEQDNSIGLQQSAENGTGLGTGNGKTVLSDQTKVQQDNEIEKQITEVKQVIQELESNPNSPFSKLVNLDEQKQKLAELEGKQQKNSLSEQNGQNKQEILPLNETTTNAGVEEGSVGVGVDVPTSLRGVKYSDIIVGDKYLEDILSDNKLSEEEKQQVREVFARGVDYFKFDKEGEQKFQQKFANPEDIADIADIIEGVSLAKEAEFNFYNTKNYENVIDAVNYIANNPNEYSPKVVKAVKEIKEKLDNPSSSMNRLYAVDVMKELGITEQSVEEQPKAETEKTTDQKPQDDIKQKKAELGQKLFNIAPKNPIVEEIKSKNLTHVRGKNMGENQSLGTFISTEKGNRYETADNKAEPVDVDIKNPLVVENDLGLVGKRTEILNENKDQFTKEDAVDYQELPDGKITLDDLNDAGIKKLAKLTTEKLQADGYDGIYFKESKTQEGELVVFDKNNVKFKNDNNEDVNKKQNGIIQQSVGDNQEKKPSKRGKTKLKDRKRGKSQQEALNKYPENLDEYVMQGFIGGAKLSPEAIIELYGDSIEEVNSRRGIGGTVENNGMSLNQMAHSIWENMQSDLGFEMGDSQDVRNAIESVVGAHPRIKTMVDELNKTNLSEEYRNAINEENKDAKEEEIDEAMHFIDTLTDAEIEEYVKGNEESLKQQIDNFNEEVSKSNNTKRTESEIKSDLKLKNAELKILEEKQTKLNKQLEQNLKENQLDLLQGAKPQSMFDDKVDQQKIAGGIKDEITSKREELSKLQDELDNINQTELDLTGKDLVADALDRIASKLPGNRLQITPTERTALKKDIIDLGRGLIHIGKATIEDVIDHIKAEIKKRFPKLEDKFIDEISNDALAEIKATNYFSKSDIDEFLDLHKKDTGTIESLKAEIGDENYNKIVEQFGQKYINDALGIKQAIPIPPNSGELKPYKYDTQESEANALKRITDGISDLPKDEQQAEIDKRAKAHSDSYKEYLKTNPLNEQTKQLPRVADFESQTAEAMADYLDDKSVWKGKEENKFENGGRIDENGNIMPEQMYINLKEKIKALRADKNNKAEIDKINSKPAEYYNANKLEFEGEPNIGIKRRITDERREAMGLQPIELPKLISVEAGLHMAKAAVDAGLVNPMEVENDLIQHLDNPTNASASRNDVEILKYRRLQLEQREKSLLNIKSELENKLKENPSDELSAELLITEERLNNNSADLERNTVASRIVSNIFANLGQGLQTEYNIEGEIQQLVRKIRDNYGNEIPPHVKAIIDKLELKAKQLQAQNEEIEKKYNEISGEKRDKDFDEAVRAEVEKITKNRQSGASGPKAKRNRLYGKDLIASGFDKIASALGIRLMAEGAERPSLIQGLSEIGQGLIDEGSATIGNVIDKLSEYIKDKLGDKIDFEDLKDEVEESIMSNQDKFTQKATEAESVKEIAGELKKKMRVLVEQGITDRKEIVRLITEDVKKAYTEIGKEINFKERDISDVLSDYGKKKFMSDHPIDKAVRDIKRQLKLASAIEDVLMGKAPEKSGLIPDTMSDTVRRMRNEVKDLMKKNGIEEKSPEQKWATALDAIKTRLRNEISDLNTQINDEKRFPKKTSGVVYDKDATDLKNQRDVLKQTLDNIVSREKDIQDIISEVERIAGEENSTTITTSMVKDRLITELVSNKLQNGMPSKDVIKSVFDDLKQVLPDVTEAQIKDAYLRQGIFKRENKTKTQLQKELSDFRSQLKTQKIIDDLKNGIATEVKKQGERSVEVIKFKNELLDAKKAALNQYAHLSAAELQKQITATQNKINKGEFTKAPNVKAKFQNNQTWAQNNQQLNNIKVQLKNLQQQAMESKKNTLMKVMDIIDRWLVRGIFFGSQAYQFKLGASAISSIVHKPFEDLLGGVIYNNLFKNISKNAPIEGSTKNSASALIDYYKNNYIHFDTLKGWWQIFKSGKTTLDKEQDKNYSANEFGNFDFKDKNAVQKVGEFLAKTLGAEHIPLIDLLSTDPHAMIKEPIKRGTYKAAYNAYMNWVADNMGADAVNDPLVIETAKNAAYLKAKGEIFMGSTITESGTNKPTGITGLLNHINSSIMNSRNEAIIEGDNMKYALASLYKFFLPIVKVPSNIISRALKGNPLVLISNIYSAYKKDAGIKGGEKITNEEADAIIRDLKKGTVTAAWWIAGFMAAGAVAGGFYNPFYSDEERKKRRKTAKSNEILLGQKPHSLIDLMIHGTEHTSQVTAMMLGATFWITLKHYNKDEKENLAYATAIATGATANATAELHPVFNFTSDIFGALKSEGGMKRLGKDIERRFDFKKKLETINPADYYKGKMHPKKNKKEHK